MPPSQEFPRRYLAAGFDPSDLAQVREAFRELERRPLPDLRALERWCVDAGELGAALWEESSIRWVDSTCRTGDGEVQARYAEWIETVEPELKERVFRLDRRLAEHPAADRLPGDEFAVMLRSTRNWIDLYREENLALEREESLLVNEYNRVTGSRMVRLDGREVTIPQAYTELDLQDRDRRERAWRAVNERYWEDREEIGPVFDRLLDLRERIARNAGFEDYRAFRFREMDRFDYTPEDCERFHESVARVAVPVERRLHEERARKLGLERLRPWDYSVDPDGNEPLRPFRTAGDLIEGARALFGKVHPAFAGHFETMVRSGLLDLESREGKAPGAYKISMFERRLPFVFLNAAGTHQDLTTLMHECGHAFHDLEYRHQRLLHNRNAPSEFAEVASMGMELLASTFLEGSFYDAGTARRARRQHLEHILSGFGWISLIDAFQHWVYTHPGHSADERDQAWVECTERYKIDTDWTGLEHIRRVGWQKVTHLFRTPFYMIEYSVAQLGALQVWRNYLDDPDRAVDRFRSAMALGNSRPLPELFEAAGIRFDFSEETLGEMLAFAGKEYRNL